MKWKLVLIGVNEFYVMARWSQVILCYDFVVRLEKALPHNILLFSHSIHNIHMLDRDKFNS